ncbi:MAG: GntR family transcriptional regulator [Hylemonella sp.]|jgi:DNA-binding GntR family transcriptional regulator
MSTTRQTSKATSTERVYFAVYRAILEHRLQPGTWLREEEMAKEFDLSRTVVRQALQRLAQDGVIELQHNRGARVPILSLEDAAHVFEARRIFECEVARKLGGRLSEVQFAALEKLVAAEAQADANGDRAEAIRLSGELHLTLARWHGNPLLVRLLSSLLPTTSLLMARFKLHGGQVCVAHKHVDLIKALLHSPAIAANEMKRHLNELEQSLSEDSAPTQPLRNVFAAYRDGSGVVNPASSHNTS